MSKGTAIDVLNYGPSFGSGDLVLGNNFYKNCCVKRTYEEPIRESENNFFVEEYEVFQIIKN